MPAIHPSRESAPSRREESAGVYRPAVLTRASPECREDNAQARRTARYRNRVQVHSV